MTGRRRWSPLRVLCILALGALASSCDEAGSHKITLRIGSGHPAGPAVYPTQMRDYFVPEVERRVAEATDYELHFVEGYGGSIASVAETLESVQSGILDVGAYCVCFEPSKLFLHNFMYYSPFGPQDSEQSIQIARRVYDQYSWLSEQLEREYKQTLLALNGWDNYHLGTTRPWTTVDDLKGVKIGGAGPNLPWLSYAGVVPVQSTLPDGYLALQTGVYQGWLMFPSAYHSFKFHEPAPYYTLIGFGSMGGAVVMTMNLKRMNKLPPEVVEIIKEVALDFEAAAAAELNARQIGGLDDLRQAGAHVRVLPESGRTKWAESLRAFPNDMAQDANRRGMPGTEIMRAYISEVAKSGYDWPVDYVIDAPDNN